MENLKTGHVGLNVTDLSRSLPFYQEAFGLELMGRHEANGSPFAFIGRDGNLLLTLWQQSGGEFAKDRPGLHHLSFQLADIAAVRAVESRLKGLGATLIYDGVVPHSEGGQSAALFFLDPDGIRLEVFSPSGGDGMETPTPGAPSCGFF